MLVVISPAKTLDFDSEISAESASQPLFLDEAEYLVGKLKKFSAKKLEGFFNVNSEIASQNKQRFMEWSRPFHSGNARQAALAFQGEVYRGLNAETLNDPDFEFAEKHLYILSGLYGILRPLDLIQPYRLEMGTKWEITKKAPNLYKFWGSKITDVINDSDVEGPLINLASNEYFKVIDKTILKRDIITCHFKDKRNGEYKSLMTYAKHARGLMARFIIREKLTEAEHLKAFDGMGYQFNPSLSTDTEYTFTREEGSIK